MFKIIFLTFIFLISQLQAKEPTELKLGVGLSLISMPGYIGSSVQKQYIFPYPYIHYESEYLTVEKNMLFNHLYHANNFDIDLSLSGTLSVKNDSNSPRYNMKQLDPTLEVGPNFIYKLFNFKDKKSYLSIELPVRAVVSIDFPDIHHEGYITNPNLYLKYYTAKDIQLELSTGPTFATKDYYNYFYEVTAKDVTAHRQEYHSIGGFGGWKSTSGLSYQNNNIWYGAFVRYYNLNNAKFIDSPLVNQHSAVFYGTAISYIF